MLESLAQARYEDARRRHQADFFRLASVHFERLGWTGEQLLAERERRLRDLLAVARQRSPWHRDRLTDVDPRGCTEADLRAIPIMTKDDLMANFDRIVAPETDQSGLQWSMYCVPLPCEPPAKSWTNCLQPSAWTASASLRYIGTARSWKAPQPA